MTISRRLFMAALGSLSLVRRKTPAPSKLPGAALRDETGVGTVGGPLSITFVSDIAVLGTHVDWTMGTFQTVTVTGNSHLTFTAPPGPARLTLRVRKSAAGGTIGKWPRRVRWAYGEPPMRRIDAGSVDIAVFDYDGKNYYGRVSTGFC